jgi:predicted permease
VSTLRSLRKSPGYTAATILILALAIGVNGVIFSAAEAVVLRPFAVPHIDDLVDVGRSDPTFGAHYGLNPAELYDLETRHDLFDAVAGYRSIDMNVTGSGDPQRVAAVVTTSGFFRVFEIQPFIGRFYNERDEREGATNVVVLSFDFWRAYTGADRNAIGRTININDSSFTILGVLPPRFTYPLGVHVWTPRPLDPLLDRHASLMTQYSGAIVPAIARMRPEMTVPRLQRALTATVKRWADQNPQIYSNRIPQPIEVRSLTVTWAGKLRPILFALIGAVVLVLLIACANIASLQLLRATSRSREIAIRMAVGASRLAVLKLFAAESALLAAAGGVIGVLLCRALIATVGRTAARIIPELQNLRISSLVLAWSAAATSLAALLFGVGPALNAMRRNARDVLNATGSRNASSGRARVGLLQATIVVQVAISLMLVLASGVALRSLVGLLRINPGFDSYGVITARVALPPSRYKGTTVPTVQRVLALHEDLMRRLRDVPGFAAVGTADVAPFSYRGTLDAAVHGLAVTADVGAAATRHAIPANTWYVDAGYFRALKIPLLKGSGFTGTEQADWLRNYPNGGATPVLIDEVLAAHLFAGADPIGKLIDAPYFRVIGVVGAVKKSDLTATSDDAGAIYIPSVGGLGEITLVVRSSLPFPQSVARLQAALHAFDPRLPLFDVAPLSDVVARSAGARRVAVWLFGSLATLSLVLAMFGTYAVISYATSQRTKEIGIRVALGAQSQDIVAIVAKPSAVLTSVGLAIGLIGYLIGERGLASLAYGVSPNDPSILVGAICALAVAGLVASVPAIMRAIRIGPIEALRSE